MRENPDEMTLLPRQFTMVIPWKGRNDHLTPAAVISLSLLNSATDAAITLNDMRETSTINPIQAKCSGNPAFAVTGSEPQVYDPKDTVPDS